MKLFAVLCASCVLSLVLVGCGNQSDLTSHHLAKQMVLKTEPGDIKTIDEVRESLKENEEITLIGKIGGMPNPWVPGKAAFMIVDPFDPEAHDCGADCAFCANKKSQDEKLALIRFVDEDGRLISSDAKRSLGVKANDLVVIKGKASIHKLGYLVVAANGVYIRR